MRSEYDFSQLRKNPYANQLKGQVTIRLDVTAVEYFQQVAAALGMPNQDLINLFLRDCAAENRRPISLKPAVWRPIRNIGRRDRTAMCPQAKRNSNV